MSDLLAEVTFFLQRLDALAVLDLLLVTGVFFLVVSVLRGTRAVVLLRGMVLLIIIMVLLTSLLPLPAFSSFLTATLPALLFVIPVVYVLLSRVQTGVKRRVRVVLHGPGGNGAAWWQRLWRPEVGSPSAADTSSPAGKVPARSPAEVGSNETEGA
jgi:diadenylate cyclase